MRSFENINENVEKWLELFVTIELPARDGHGLVGNALGRMRVKKQKVVNGSVIAWPYSVLTHC
jgi:hypothetical protein